MAIPNEIPSDSALALMERLIDTAKTLSNPLGVEVNANDSGNDVAMDMISGLHKKSSPPRSAE